MPPSLDSCPAWGGDAPGDRRSARAVRCAAALFLATIMCPLPASAQKVRITNVSDVNFGLISNLQSDSRQSQNICLYSNSIGSRYSIAAAGSGTGSSFALSSGSNSLAYEVEWNDQSGQTMGTSLAPNVVVTGQASSATHQFCNSGPATSASLTIVFRSSDLSQAREGSYSGSLTLLISAE